jgi:predicted DNA-binding transcriptional regulator AlpA
MRRLKMREVAEMVGVSLSLFRRHLYGYEKSRLLVNFPEPCARGRRVLWLDIDIEKWLAAQSTYKPAETPVADPVLAPPLVQVKLSRPRGRPRKIVASL